MHILEQIYSKKKNSIIFFQIYQEILIHIISEFSKQKQMFRSKFYQEYLIPFFFGL